MSTMLAAILGAPRRFGLLRAALPQPAAGEVRIAVQGSGVCASSLPLWEGRDWFEYPTSPGTPGHEGWGLVDAIGDGVTTVREGDRVAYLSTTAFAEYDIAAADGLVQLPPALDGKPFPAEAVACAMNAFRRTEAIAGQTAAVIGIGFLGAILVRLLSRAGMHVIALSRRPYALDLAKQCGAEETINLSDRWQAAARVWQRTGGAGCSRVIEAVGVQDTLDLATDLVGQGGRLVIAGYHQDGRRSVDMQSWNWKGIDVVNAHERDRARYVQGMREGVAAVLDGTIPLETLLTPFPLGQIDDAFRSLEERREPFVKAVVLT
ncbi:MAG: zinc-binding dehydrogenase [Acidobacteria bacterium]|nr:zinc-binding dehydrogenase [Acidobacteriota bacterium]